MKKLKNVFQTLRRIGLAIFAILVAVLLTSQSAIALSGAQRRKFAANDIMFYDPDECTSRGMSASSFESSPLDATAINKILNAKNAEVHVFNLSDGDEWSAKWSDNDTESMARLLRNYGDLAYQLGEAVGAPWIAILVQMRYEDPNSVCGTNNFWGNGCDSSHSSENGSKIKGYNLGEGFVQYGNTLRNGYHDQALGISNPKEYLEKLGPTWVDGPFAENPVGYRSIEAMKKSVDALTEFVESSEGQEIVKEFGNYKGSGTIYRSSCGVGIATNGEAVFYQQGDPRWGGKPYGDCGGDTIANAGCGPTSLASIIATMIRDASVTPDIIAEEAANSGYRLCGSGSYHTITNLAQEYGLTVTNYGRPSVEEINEKLRAGEMFHVAGRGSAPFSSGGHFIAIRGITEDGMWLIFDSGGKGDENSLIPWDPSDIYPKVHSDWRGVKR